MNILESEIVSQMILPFLLVFVVVFAILQKSKILGEGKEKIDALASLAIALLLVAIPQPRGIVVGLMPWLAVGVIVILVYLLLYGMVVGDLSAGKVPEWMKKTFAALAAIFTAGIVIYVSGLWKVFFEWSSVEGNGDIWISVVMIVVIIGVAAIAVNSAKKKDK